MLLRRYSVFISVGCLLLSLWTTWKSDCVSHSQGRNPTFQTRHPSPTSLVGEKSTPPGPTAQPAIKECELPFDVMAPTNRPSSTAYPSLHPQSSTSYSEHLVENTRAASLRRATSQCGMIVSDQLGNASAKLSYCEDYARSVMEGSREVKDGSFITHHCKSLWFSPSEACDLLQGIGKLILFVGDSISRQLQQGLFTVLTGS